MFVFREELLRVLLVVVIAVGGSYVGDAFAGNNKCCESKDKYSGCSGCIGMSSDGDDEIDFYVNIGNHSAKKCKSGGTGNCTETADVECASSTNLTKYKRRVAGVCQGQDGTVSSIAIGVEQCDNNDTQCSSS